MGGLDAVFHHRLLRDPTGGAAGPLVAGVLGGWSIRAVFVFNAVIYALMVGFVYRNVRH